MASINCLPREILLQIFQNYLLTETQYDFMNCIPKVCRKWQELCKDNSLWQEFDGTLPFELLKDYCNAGLLKECKKLIFSKLENFPTAKEIEKVYRNLPQLKCVNFSYVMGMRSNHFIGELYQQCPELQEVVFNDILHNYKISPGIIGFPIHSCKLFDNFLKMRGHHLVSLVFSHLYLTADTELFDKIGRECPNLEILKVENIVHDSKVIFPISSIQMQCPKLRILSLEHPVIIHNLDSMNSFKNLETFRFPSHLNYLFPNCPVYTVICESPKLKELNISKCVFVKSNCLHPIIYSLVEKLNVSFGMVYDETCFIEVIQKWSYSLKELDVSNIYDESINEMFLSVILSGGLQNLTVLNLKKTYVTIPIVKLIVQHCKKLRVLNLECCLELDEFSSKYEGETAIKMLSSRLEPLICFYH